ncbi:UDP-glycosyltransferase 83A1-like [Humulus lupulus]|uniref:UDP-glycosyltransferase 83A1-like n=1 Tax=Humulus lupulus TaxID=3486 RepID=UPI002B415A06|nr:UDP-glycosyltransferase 83A1-like [Humulus lupulus]
MGIPHILAIPFPAQGHVIPLMELCQCLVNQGCKVTFVNTDYNHKRVINAMSSPSHIGDQIHMVSIPDGMEPWEDRNDIGKLLKATQRVMRAKLEELITMINESEDYNITCVLADETLGWALEAAEKMNIQRAVFWPAAAAVLALSFSIPKLIDDGIINTKGVLLKNQMIQLAPMMPTTKTENLVWACIGDATTQRIVFETLSRNNQTVKLADWILCNSAIDLEPAAFALAPEIIPIGPMLASTRLGISSGNFWAEDLTCLEWLDQQLPSSVIYIAFGSFTVFDKIQFHELALGLEISKRPFLWVVREDIGDKTNHAYPDGFLDRVKSRGKIVNWAPQQKVLGHPSIAFFLTHCGWNSTLEGISNGVPFLCWPYFADQFLNESYICDVWNVGERFERDEESGIIKQGEIKKKVEQVVGDEKFKSNALNLKELAMNNVMQGGQSDIVFNNFIDWLQS